jgi:rare lipoprotein A
MTSAVLQARWWILLTLVAASACVHMAPPEPMAVDYQEEGKATFYGSPASNRRGGVSNSREWDPGMTVGSHRSLPIGSCVNVMNLENGMEARVHITDHGAYSPGVVIDLSYMAARRIGMLESRYGTTRVRLTPCS